MISVPNQGGHVQVVNDETSHPTLTDDRNKGYTHGSLELDTVGKRGYICVDPTIGAAKWRGVTTEFFNGTFLETLDADVASDGATITMSLQRDGGGDLTMVFSDGETTLDCTPAATLTLTPGSDTSPGRSFVYILQSDKILAESTSGWPTAEHIKVVYLVLQSAATTQTKVPLGFQQINDHASDTTTNLGHLNHIVQRLRAQHAIYKTGMDETISIAGAGPSTVDIAITAGTAFQLHVQATDAIDTSTGDDIHVVNDSVAAFTTVTDIADMLTDAAGGSMAQRYFNLVFWLTANKTGTETHLMCNLPTGSYNTLTGAQQDVSGFDVINVPAAFDVDGSLAVMLYRYTFRHTNAGGGTWTHESTVNLRGQSPTTGAGGGTTLNQTTFSDNAFELFDNGDDTKRMAFQLSGITAANTRILTVQDADYTLAGINIAQAWTENQKLNDNVELQFGDAGHAIIKGDSLNLVIDPLAGRIDTNGGDLQCSGHLSAGSGAGAPGASVVLTASESSATITQGVTGTVTHAGTGAQVSGLSFTASHTGAPAGDYGSRGLSVTGIIASDVVAGRTVTSLGVRGLSFLNTAQSNASIHMMRGIIGEIDSDVGGKTAHSAGSLYEASIYGAKPVAQTGAPTVCLQWAGQFDYHVQINDTNKLLLGGSDTALGVESIRASASSIIFEANSGDEMTVAADNLTFNNGATDTGLAWGTNGRLDFKVGLGIEMSMAANTLTFNAGASDPVFNWATSGLLKQTTGSFEVTVGYIAVADGMVAPGAGAGLARIYVDTADGDLKVVFANGFVAVLAADS